MFSIIFRMCMLGVFGGCSFFMSGVDPNWDRKHEPKCTKSYTTVIVDGLVAVTAAEIVRQQYSSEPSLPDELIPVSLGASLVYTASAWVGATKYKNCRKARAEWHVSEAIRQATEGAARAPGSASPPVPVLPATRTTTPPSSVPQPSGGR
jgi:hypothetical protein